MFKHICPVITPTVNWKQYLELTNQQLGRPITASLDKKAEFELDIRSFLATLGELQVEGSSIDYALRKDNWIPKQVSYTFLIYSLDRQHIGLQVLGCNVLESSNPRLALVSNTLEGWRQTCLRIYEYKFDKELLQVMNELVQYFELIGLRELFHNYTKKQHGDCFLLEAK